MILLTPEIRAQLRANDPEHGLEHVPVVKLFNPLGPGVWLATCLEPDGDRLWGIADLEMDCAEYGPFSLIELQQLDVGLGLGIERDILFETHTRLRAWLEVIDKVGGIRAAEPVIARFEMEG